jgi:A/G-specific adenine glycosylase
MDRCVRVRRCYARRVTAIAAGPDLDAIRADVLGWYAAERRDFPWRGTTDPYAVLVSEVMLQQTQASRVAVRYVRFLARFPTADALAAAPTSDVLAEWTGLGYNRRALALQRAAAAVSAGGWPSDVEGLERLPGVGPYTARAIASLAFGRPVGVVDTNVRRWLLRRFGGPDGQARLQSMADALARGGRGEGIAAWTHASMELGAAVCRARSPRCQACPIAAGCPSRGAAASVPVPRQPPLRGSDRAYRGALVSHLAAAPGHALAEPAARAGLSRASGGIGPALDDAGWERIVAGLERDGLAHRRSGRLQLGAATIRP